MKWLGKIITLKNKYSFQIVVFFLIFFLVLFFYGQYLSLYFSQDDFFHLSISQTDGSLKAFLDLFSFRSFADRGGIYFYRPIFREAIFNIYYSLFGLNALPFRITQFMIHFINIVLTYILALKITKNKQISVIASGFFGIAAANIGILSYLAGGIQMLGMTMFALLSIIFYINFLERKLFKFKLFSFVFFLLALSSHENATVLPFINVVIYMFKNKLNLKNIFLAFKDNIALFVCVLLLFLSEIFIIGLPTSEQQYGVNLSVKSLINSYLWYLTWAVGIPEMLIDFVGPGAKLNPNLMKYWGNFFTIIFSTFSLIFIFIFSTLPKIYKSRIFLFAISWIFVGIAPVILLPFHKQYYYLGFVLPAVGINLGFVFKTIYDKSKTLSYIFLALFLVLTFASVKLADTNYWSISRSKLSKLLINDLISKYPTLPKGSRVYFTNAKNQPYFNEEWGNSSKQASIVLSGSDALQLLYNDKSLKVYYEDLDASPSGKLIYPVEAVIYR